jgi:O-antigen/teichoic acid export membrane protein
VFQFSWPLSLSLGLNWVQWQSYRFILQNISGEDLVGLFAAGYAVIASVISAYEVFFSQFYTPNLYHDISDQDSSGRAGAWNRYANLYLPSIVVTVAFAAAGGPFLAKLMVGSHFYTAAMTVAPMAALAEGARLIGTAYQMAAFTQLDMRMAIRPTLIGASLTFVGVLTMSRWNPLIGTGLALFLGATVAALLLAIKLHRTLSLRLHGKRMLWSLVMCLPFMGVVLSNWLIRPSSTMFGAIISLTIMGLYFLAAQFALARQTVTSPESYMPVGSLMRWLERSNRN